MGQKTTKQKECNRGEAKHAAANRTGVVGDIEEDPRQQVTRTAIKRLKQYALDHGYEVTRVFQEQASGIDENRKQLHHLLQLAEQHEIQRVLIEFPDRLVRFGYRYLERFLSSHGVTVEVTHKTEPKSSQEELVTDWLTIVTGFSARLYGKRSQEFGQKTKQLIDEMEGGEVHGDADENGQDRRP